jgi:ATP-dependent helicase HrpA
MAVREKIETALTRVRSRRAHDLDEALYQFYAARITGVSSVHDLNRLVRARITREPDFLCATEADLIGDDDATYDRTLFPDSVSLGNTALPVTYAYAPGAEADGVTVRVPLPIASQLTTGQLQWMVPGLREEQIAVLLRALPKRIRKPLMPIEPKIREVAAEFDPGREDFLQALAEFLTRKYRIAIQREDWPPQSLPAHLQLRIEIVDRADKAVLAGRDLAALQADVEKRDDRSEAWQKAAQHWERRGLTVWSVGDLPESVLVENVGGAQLLAYPGLALRDGEVDLRLFRKREEAARAAAGGVRRLAELVLARDLARLWKELGSISGHSGGAQKRPASLQDAFGQLNARLQPAGAAASPEILQKSAYEHILAHLFQLDPILPLTEARFLAMVEAGRRELPALAYKVREVARQILDFREMLLASPKKYPDLLGDVDRLAPPDFLARTPPAQLPHLHRYLRAVQIRAERAAVSPAKDSEKAKQLAQFVDWPSRVPAANRETFRWLLEEFRVSLFAQELGTARPVSAARLRELGEF